MKTCCVCGEAQPLNNFHKRTASKDNLSPQCKKCKKELRKKYPWNPDVGRLYYQRKEVRERKRALQLAKKYGITEDEYTQMLLAQDRVCAICGDAPQATVLAVDHDHNTGKIRGLLCKNCNTGIGFFGDSLERVEKVVEYLKEHEEKG